MTPENPNEVIDVGFDVGEAELDRPVLKPGTYKFTITSTSKEPSKSTEGGENLVVNYSLAEMAESTKGEPINPGFTLRQWNPMKPVGKMTEKQIKDRLGSIHFAATGEKTGKITTDKWIGKTVRVRIALREPRKNEQTGQEYGASNDIQRVYPATE